MYNRKTAFHILWCWDAQDCTKKTNVLCRTRDQSGLQGSEQCERYVKQQKIGAKRSVETERTISFDSASRSHPRFPGTRIQTIIGIRGATTTGPPAQATRIRSPREAPAASQLPPPLGTDTTPQTREVQRMVVFLSRSMMIKAKNALMKERIWIDRVASEIVFQALHPDTGAPLHNECVITVRRAPNLHLIFPARCP